MGEERLRLTLSWTGEDDEVPFGVREESVELTSDEWAMLSLLPGGDLLSMLVFDGRSDDLKRSHLGWAADLILRLGKPDHNDPMYQTVVHYAEAYRATYLKGDAEVFEQVIPSEPMTPEQEAELDAEREAKLADLRARFAGGA